MYSRLGVDNAIDEPLQNTRHDGQECASGTKPACYHVPRHFLEVLPCHKGTSDAPKKD